MVEGRGERLRRALHHLAGTLRSRTGGADVRDSVSGAVGVSMGESGGTTAVSRRQRSRLVQRDGRTLTEETTIETRIETDPRGVRGGGKEADA
jgi:uncharacterized membrane protein